MTETITQKTFKGTIWSAIENFSLQGIQFIVMLVMARILTPSDYGIIGMVSIFIAVSNSFVNSGFSQALIRKKERTNVDNCTVFYFNVIISFCLYIILFFCAPFIARFYNEPILVPVTRVVGLSLIINGLSIVQSAVFSIKIDFKTVAKASLISAGFSGFVGILLAYLGFGVWSLVYQQILGALIQTFLFWHFSSWRPSLIYSWSSFKDMFSFGSRLLISGLIDTIYTNIYQLFIGKIYKASDLGYFTRASNFGGFASASITGIVHRVVFPVLCSIQEDNEKLCDGYRRLLKVLSFIVFPLMTGLAAVSKPLIITLLTEKWLFSSVLLIPICFAMMWYPIHAINVNLLQVKGRSDLFLKLEIIKKIIGIVILVVTLPISLNCMCWGLVLSSLCALFINTHYTGKLINLGFIKQMKDLAPSFILSIFMGTIVWVSLQLLKFSPQILLACGTLIGIIFYIGSAKLFKFQELEEIFNLFYRRTKPNHE